MSSSCPQCQSRAFKRNGYTRHGKQNHRCLDCGRQFSLEPYYGEKQDGALKTLPDPLKNCADAMKC